MHIVLHLVTEVQIFCQDRLEYLQLKKNKHNFAAIYRNCSSSRLLLRFSVIANNLYIIAGPNGAGKTTASFTLLPDVLKCKNFVNADEIARGISPFAPETASIQAGKVMLQRISELLAAREDFAIETTLSTRSYKKLVVRAHELGYKVFLVFFYLDSPEQAKLRVAQRVKDGGHNVKPAVIERRYLLGLKNLVKLYMPLCDNVVIYNNTSAPATLIARRNGSFMIEDVVVWNKILSLV